VKCDISQISYEIGSSSSSVNTNIEKLINRFVKKLTPLTQGDFSSARVKTLVVTETLNGLLDEKFWQRKVLVGSKYLLNFPHANYTVDAIYKAGANELGGFQFAVEACFDNRQSIGTNLLKFEIARQNSQNPMFGLIIAGNRELLKEYGWDGSIASAEEYESAMTSAYAEIIRANIYLLTLGKD